MHYSLVKIAFNVYIIVDIFRAASAYFIYHCAIRQFMKRKLIKSISKIAFAFCIGVNYADSEVWKFGLIADTQWGTDDGHSPNGVAAGIISQVNAEFIKQGVKFVIAVGDLSDNSNTTDSMNTRATYAQALYNAGIGFYPLRGNHDSAAISAASLVKKFPQTTTGINNDTLSYAFIAIDSNNTHPGKKSGLPFQVGTGFSSPGNKLKGLTYAFTYNNATFVLLDQFRLSDNSIIPIAAQQIWIDTVLSNRPGGTHGFVFGHRGIAHENHPDNLFGSFNSNPTVENAFITSLANSGVRYLFCGHDHLFNRCRITTTNSVSWLQEIILGSDSYKFYVPQASPIGNAREIPISQELFTIGYSIVTVDSQCVTIEYFSALPGTITFNSGYGTISTTPMLTGNWNKRETFGYSLIGKEFAIKKDSSYASVVDTFHGTRAAILGGKNSNTAKDGGNRYFTQVVGTGWKNASSVPLQSVSSNMFTLWGMAVIMGSPTTAPFALSLSYNPSTPIDSLLAGIICLMARDSLSGAWSKAVENSSGGKKKFYVKAWSPLDSLGAHGVDTAAKIVWAVIDHGRDFIVASCGLPFPPPLLSPSDSVINQPKTLSLVWNTVNNAASYRVQVSPQSDFPVFLFNDSLTDTSKSVTLSLATTYYWRVNAKNGIGQSVWSSAFHFTTVPVIPSAPVLVSPGHGALNQPLNPSLLWKKVSSATSYRIQIAIDPLFGTVLFDSASTDTIKTIGGAVLGANTKYYWQIHAINAGGASAWSIDSFTTTPQLFHTTIPVFPGWNMVSLNIHPQDSTTGTIFSPLKGFVLAKNNNGQVYWPAYAINTIGILHTGESYKIFTDSLDTILVSGARIDLNETPISLIAGWNMIAYLPQSDMPITTALSGIISQMTIAKNNNGQVYWPDYSINTIGNMKAGEGYKIYMNTAAILTYPSNGLPKNCPNDDIIEVPAPQHFVFTSSTGNNATVGSRRVTVNGTVAPDNSEIGAFTTKGVLIGSGMVIQGTAVFPIWGSNSIRAEKIGCSASERVVFRLWTGKNEYPLDFKTDREARYAEDGIFMGSFSVPDQCFITKFDLSSIFPNPFKHAVKLSFDVPIAQGMDAQDIEINLYSIHGRLICQLVKGAYRPGRHIVSWNGMSGGRALPSSNVFIVQMKAYNFIKKLRIFKVH
jgi:hypothetical protein